jgi:predicted DNA-binding transcriptional regulator YafY
MPPPNIPGMLEVAELLADGPRTIEDIMSSCRISQRTAYRRLDMLRRHGYDVVARPGPDGVTVEILDVPADPPSA